MKLYFLAAMILAGEVAAEAQLTTAQKIADFETMANQFARRYVALQWKSVLYGVDGYDIKPFLDRAAATTNDLDYYDVCIDYVSQFHDNGHVFFDVPSDFVADMGLRVDTYDNGKPLIYAINRSALPTKTYPFVVGDEIVSIDGVPAADLMKSLAKYGTRSNPRTEAAYAALYLTVRPQVTIPHAVDLPDSSQVVIHRQGGSDETYTITWQKSGVPLRNVGPTGSPAAGAIRKSLRRLLAPESGGTAPMMAMLDPLRAVAGVGSQFPVFAGGLPASFRLRQGARSTDPFFSGTYQSGGHTIGFIRIPSFDPASVSAALTTFEQEIAYFNANTEGLVIDDMRNPGGIVYYGEEIARRLITVPFRLIGFELRSTTEFVIGFSGYVQYLQAIGAPDYMVRYQNALLDDVKGAYQQNSHTGPEPLDTVFLSPLPPLPALDTTPATDRNGKPLGYTKPMMVLTDEFSFSGADYFPAVMQDNKAAVIYGMRTSGLGGTNAAYDAGAFSEASIGMLRGLMYRKDPVTVAGYPTTNYIENVGVQPDIVDDYKTLDNLLHGGDTFVANFSAAMVKLIEGKP